MSNDGIRLSHSRRQRLGVGAGVAVPFAALSLFLLAGLLAATSRSAQLCLLALLGIITIVPVVLILLYKRRRWPKWLNTEALIERDRIVVFNGDGREQAASWAELLDVNFEQGEFRFCNGTQISLPVSLREYGLMASVTGPESPLAWAWRRYLRKPYDLPIACDQASRARARAVAATNTTTQEYWYRKESAGEPVATESEGQIRIRRTTAERWLFFFYIGYAVAFLPLVNLVVSDNAVLSSAELWTFVSSAFGIANGVVLVHGTQYFTNGAAARHREIAIDQTGVSLLFYSGRQEHRSWDELRGIDFRRGILAFADRKRVRLFGPLATDTSLLVEFAANERVTRAWHNYWARPRLDAALVSCASE